MFHPAVQVFGRNANAAARAAAMRRSQCAACVWRAACSMMTISSPKQCSVNWRGNRKCDMFVSKSMHKDDNGTPGKETEDGHTWHDHQVSGSFCLFTCPSQRPHSLKKQTVFTNSYMCFELWFSGFESRGFLLFLGWIELLP